MPVLMRFLAVLVLGVMPLLAACRTAGGGEISGPPDALRAATQPGVAVSAESVVARVVDGDTIVVETGGQRHRVRLLGIDTPESVKPDAPVECFGPQASHRTAILLPEGVRVLLETDRHAGLQDDFGRVLAYVTPQGARVSVNEELLREGYATLFVYDRRRPFTRVRAFRGAETDARRANRGLWGSCPR